MSILHVNISDVALGLEQLKSCLQKSNQIEYTAAEEKVFWFFTKPLDFKIVADKHVFVLFYLFSSGVPSFYIFHPYSAAETTHIWATPPLMDHVRDVQGMITSTRKIEIDPVAAGNGDLISWYQQVDAPAALIQRFKSYHLVMIHLPIRVTDYKYKFQLEMVHFQYFSTWNMEAKKVTQQVRSISKPSRVGEL